MQSKRNWSGEDQSWISAYDYNTCIFQEKDQAVQSAYVIATVGVKEDYYLHWFTFGGHYLINWIKEDAIWK